MKKWGHKMMSWMWSRDFSWTSYNVCNFLVEVSTFKQAINSWLLGITNSAKGQYKIYRPQYIFRKRRVFKLIKSMTNFIYQKSNSMQVSNSYHIKNLAIICSNKLLQFAPAQKVQIPSIGVPKCFYWILNRSCQI